MELRWSRSSDAFVGFGVVSFQLDRAALCCEASCEVVFDMAQGRDARTVVCPGCGGSSWVPLSTIVPSLRLTPLARPAPRRLSVVPPGADRATA